MKIKSITARGLLYCLAACFMLLAVACNKNRVISRANITNIIYEMHIADAIRSNETMGIYNSRLDSLSVYGAIFTKYAYTIDEFNYSMAFYANKPEMMTEIYTDVIRRIKNMQDNYTALSIVERGAQNLWNGADSLWVDSDSTFTKFEFDFPIKGKGMYIFTAEMQFFSDDSTANPKMEMWFASENKPDTVVAKKIRKLIKSEQFKCTLKLYLPDTLMTKMKGHFVNYDSISLNGKQHIGIKNIYVEYTEGDGVEPIPIDSIYSAKTGDMLRHDGQINIRRSESIRLQGGQKLLDTTAIVKPLLKRRDRNSRITN